MNFFVKLNQQSLKLLLKNGKSMASIAIITQSLLSILMFLFCISLKFILNKDNKSAVEPYTPISPAPDDSASSSFIDSFSQDLLKYLALFIVLEIAFILAFVVISYVSSAATILISALSYTGKKIFFQDLIFMIAKRWNRPWITLRASRARPARYAMLLVVFLAIVVLVKYPNFLTVSICVVLWIIAAIYSMYSSVVWVLAMVVSVVEEDCCGKEAVERGEKLAQGQRMHGFLLNVFFNLVALVPLVGYWLIFGLFDVNVSLLFMVNVLSLVQMLSMVEYTVLYFQCREYLGEEIEVFKDLQYTKVLV